MTPLAPPPPPAVPRLVEDVVPDDRDDPEIILSTTTVSFKAHGNPAFFTDNPFLVLLMFHLPFLLIGSTTTL